MKKQDLHQVHRHQLALFNMYKKAFTLMRSKGFTLIELLVVISIIGVLVAVSIFGLSGARESSRDARRKSDLEMIRAGLELYRSDCNAYPATQTAVGGNLVGITPPTSCAATNKYITGYPGDPIPATRTYKYTSVGTSYILCAALENAPSPAMDVAGCGSCTTTCNYKIINP